MSNASTPASKAVQPNGEGAMGSNDMHGAASLREQKLTRGVGRALLARSLLSTFTPQACLQPPRFSPEPLHF
ncbi:Hypothetical protein CAP_1593 [Chondromyces apiculatus DSM 436]|uniref:Uncharacterized protein n=1 Tax=Chondromyces apiculatus DSM 436 TaxID=1192034 RepID=A0A017SU03_9BACT|nr:Hypothetical protein CAP_1593 [Chondromyces apiculatus DSM 436]